ncbi:hypothetical protein ACMYL1_23140, partial [Salmonella enterica subsp. enterica serovar Enteritidis]|uniref:hypothetical protein n=1 Tax=Salmonella enterica TaxID=28901 RepID=UPI0039E9C587
DGKTGKVLLIHGSSGDEFGIVGKLFARDPDTGEEIWMRPFVEGHMRRRPDSRLPSCRSGGWDRPARTAP